jgi:D-xylose transport system permease protein
MLAWRGAVKAVTKSETIPIADPVFQINRAKYIAPTSAGFWRLRRFCLFYRRRSPARAQKTYELGEANYAGEMLKALPPVAAILIFIYVMNSYAGIPIPVLIFLAVALLGVFITNFTTFGRYLYAIGGNADAARLSGINNKLNILKVFVLLGALTGLASLIFTARVGSASPDAGTLKELDAIAACVIGGASLVGGRGTIFGACLGALIMASLDNGMSLLNVRDFMQDIVKGSFWWRRSGSICSARNRNLINFRRKFR